MLEKTAKILTLAKQPVLKDHIIRKCALSSLQYERYINQLLEAGLLDAYPAINLKGRKNHHRMTFQTSNKGLEFLKRYAELLRLLEISVKEYPKVKF
jgi:predicted transcriptional regulator